jgi:hypothetical protein
VLIRAVDLFEKASLLGAFIHFHTGPFRRIDLVRIDMLRRRRVLYLRDPIICRNALFLLVLCFHPNRAVSPAWYNLAQLHLLSELPPLEPSEHGFLDFTREGDVRCDPPLQALHIWEIFEANKGHDVWMVLLLVLFVGGLPWYASAWGSIGNCRIHLASRSVVRGAPLSALMNLPPATLRLLQFSYSP